MRHFVVSVYDAASQVFGRPVFTPALGSAVRSFQDEVNRETADNTMFHHPQDFRLFHLGSFDDVVGSFESIHPVMLSSGDQVKIRVKDEVRS